jgi:hypothetical protein
MRLLSRKQRGARAGWQAAWGIWHVVAALLAACALCGSEAAAGEAREIGPESPLCTELNSLQPGQELVLRPGEYQGPGSIRRGGTAEAPIVIRAFDLADCPRISYLGDRSNVIDVRADHVIIRGLAFGPTRRSIDAVRIRARENVVVEDCTFAQVGGIAIVANHVSGRRFVIRRNAVRDSRSTAMYFGCHDGVMCTLDELVIERNYIHGVTVGTLEQSPGAVALGIKR